MTAKKPTAPQNEFHKSEECFLHDHSKCIGAKNADLKSSVLDLILPKCGKLKFYTVFTDKHVCLQEKEDRDSSLNPDKMEIPDMLQWDSPTPLHKRTNSPPSTFAWQFEHVEFCRASVQIGFSWEGVFGNNQIKTFDPCFAPLAGEQGASVSKKPYSLITRKTYQ
ncbi:hypothetical protein V2J09_012853 [Rumex salicifolius]